MAILDTDAAPAGRIARLADRLRAALGNDSDASLTRRLAGMVFIIRVASAGIAYAGQILLARWMGGSEYGVYVYVWTWVLLLGSLMHFGISVSAQKIIPEYRVRGQIEMLRGFLSGGRWLTFAISAAASIVLAGLVAFADDQIDPQLRRCLLIACAVLPAFTVANVQDGIARAYDWMRLALVPQFVLRQTLIIGLLGAMLVLGLKLDAPSAMLASAIAVWVAMLGQGVLLDRRLSREVMSGPKSYDIRGWLAVSLPILLVEGFYLLLSYVDILVLQQYRPAQDVGVYYAVVKTLALVSFVHYAMSASTAHRFVAYHAAGDTAGLEAYVRHASKWTFWPSLAATCLLLACGKPLLWLFGGEFEQGYAVMFALAIGLVARAVVGPVERLLNMLGQQYLCATAYAAAFAANLGLCFVLIPPFGGIGAASATSIALVFETIVLFWIVRVRLKLDVLPFSRRSA